MAKTIVLTEADRTRLAQVLDVNHSFGSEKAGQCLKELNSDLETATIVASDDVPDDIVTMNSRVVLRDRDGEEEEWVLSFPNNADIYENRVSVLAPMGVAMLGTRVGDMISWETPAGESNAEVVKISYQPEAAGDFHL